MAKEENRQGSEADICLILEGSYPYVSGGVSLWVHELINFFSHWKFGLVHLSPHSSFYGEPKFTLPENVISFEEIYIHDRPFPSEKKLLGGKKEALDQLSTAYNRVIEGDLEVISEIHEAFEKGDLTGRQILEDLQSYNLVESFYDHFQDEVSYLNYFWNLHFIHTPLLMLLENTPPKARVYHTVTTGYAGFYALLAHLKWKRPLLLTEHGIYTREREIEIDRLEWLRKGDREGFRLQGKRDFFRSWWKGFFKKLAQIVYYYSDKIITLYRENQIYQKEEGASPQKLRLIPNGIDIEKYGEIEKEGDPFAEDRPFHIALVGRVVPIKNIKTFMRAIKILSLRDLDFRASVIGPTDEDPEYYKECQELLKVLKLAPWLEFTGRKDMMESYPEIDILVLTSIQESQPLVVIEANGAGIPAVTTDVGCCRELLLGKEREDRELGPSGMITPLAQPEKTAEAISQLCSHEDLYRQMSKAGKKRVQKYYNQKDLIESYKRIYKDALSTNYKAPGREEEKEIGR